MALAERAELVARLSLKDDFSGKLRGVEGKLAGLGRAAGRAGKAISVGLGAGLAVGAAATLGAVRSGLGSLAELESATTSVDAAIKQMGLTGKVTSGQIATWANEIEASVGAAFDDKAITQAATSLIRYGKVTDKNLRPALVVMTDLAAKTGDVEGAATLLAKALADPAKAAGKLARQGVILTKVEQDQIKALTEAGDVTGAQTVLLDALTKSTKGAAAASQGPYARSIATLHDAWEDATRALAVGFLPVLEEVRDILSKELAKPETLNRIRDFGKGLAGGLGSLIDAAKKVPWDQVGDAMRLAGQGAKAAYDLFTGLPPWVQTAVLTGWGLNKLTGGALGSIVGELGKGLIKGVLGMNAGVVNINAGVVNGGPGGAAGPGGIPVTTIAAAVAPGILAAIQQFLIGEAYKPGGAADQLGVKGQLKPIIGIGGMFSNLIEDFGTYVEVFGKGIDLWQHPKPPPGTSAGGPDDRTAPSAVPFSAADYAAKLGKAQVDAQIRAEELWAHGNFRWAPSSTTQIEDRRSNNTDQTTAINRVQEVAKTKLANLERKASEGKAATDRSGSAIVSATRNEQGAVVSAINGMRLQNTTNLTINVPGQAPIYRTYQTGTTMNRVTTGTGSAELQRRTG